MSNPLTSAIRVTWLRNGPYGQRLVGDLRDEQFLAQPMAGRMLNHPAWILSHLNVYKLIAGQMLRGEAFPDPIDHPDGPKSEPVGDAAVYLPPSELVAKFMRLHEEAAKALEAAGADVFARPVPVERWRAMAPTVGDMLVMLMVKHESHHLGQLSMWRRAMGLARVAM